MNAGIKRSRHDDDYNNILGSKRRCFHSDRHSTIENHHQAQLEEENSIIRTELIQMKSDLSKVRDEFTNYVLMFAKEMKEMKEMLNVIAREINLRSVEQKYFTKYIQSH
jgi:hypothetical protein